MCGILGISSFVYKETGDKFSNLIEKNIFAKALNIIEHRGPDDIGVYFDENIIIGHRRLSIIDLSSAGKQPMKNEDDTIYVVFNGEIYNFRELKDRLQEHEFSSKTDTEVLIHGYEEWGITNLLSKLDGQFAFALFDKNRDKLYLARDRFGIKPLYYSIDNQNIFFSSQPAPLYFIRKKMGLPLTIDRIASEIYFEIGYIPSPFTFVEEIKKLLPGTYLEIYTGKDRQYSENSWKKRLKLKKYWKPSIKSVLSDKQNISDTLQRILSQSVEKRLIADVPVGAFLSGGIDSSIIVSLMKDIKEDIHTFSIGFENQEYDETDYAKAVSDFLNTEHHIHYVNENVFSSIAENIHNYYDEPFADISMIPTALVSEFTRKYVKVALSGDGGDELFGGYNRYRYGSAIKTIVKTKIYPLFQNISRIISESNIKYIIPRKLWRFCDILSSRAESPYIKMITIHRIKHRYIADLFWRKYSKYCDYYLAMNSFDINIYLPDDILVKVDRASMRHSLEVRVPFLSHKVGEYAFKIDKNLKIFGKTTKYILKKAFRKRLPKKIYEQRKQGFEINIEDYLSSVDINKKIFLDYFTQTAIDKITSKKRAFRNLYWAMYVYERIREGYNI